MAPRGLHDTLTSQTPRCGDSLQNQFSRDVQLIGNKPGCDRSNSGSNPDILPNTVHNVKTCDGETP